MTACGIWRAASARSASAAPSRVLANVTSPACVLCTSARFTHTGSGPTSSTASVGTTRLSMKGTLASLKWLIMRSR